MAVRFFVLRHSLLLLVLFSATSALPSRPAASRRALNRDWYARRAAADPAARRKRRGSRASRAERAADALYEPVSIDPSVCFPGLAQAELEAAAERLLADCHATSARQPPPPPPPPAAAASPAASSAGLAGGVMWGDCSVGPVLRQRLVGAGLQAPTAIQSAAFGPLSRGSNGLLSAQTGAGKTLAFVLPLLSRLRRGDAYCALVVCPSLELASQLGRSVELLWPAEASSGGGAAQPALRVVQPVAEGEGDAAEGDALLAQLDGSPLLAGTPHTLRALFAAAAAAEAAASGADPTARLPRGPGGGPRGRGRGGRGWRGRGRGRGGRGGRGGAGEAAPARASARHSAAAAALRSSVRVVVLDEADQLLGSDALAVAAAARRGREAPLTARERAAERRATPPSPTELLLREAPWEPEARAAPRTAEGRSRA